MVFQIRLWKGGSLTLPVTYSITEVVQRRKEEGTHSPFYVFILETAVLEQERDSLKVLD